MICQLCFEEEVLEGESLCKKCKRTNIDESIETLDELIEKMD